MNLLRNVAITGNITGTDNQQVYTQIQKILDSYQLPSGYKFKQSGDSEDMVQSFYVCCIGANDWGCLHLHDFNRSIQKLYSTAGYHGGVAFIVCWGIYCFANLWQYAQYVFDYWDNHADGIGN